MNKRGVGKKIFILTISIILAFVLCEVLFRLFIPREYPSIGLLMKVASDPIAFEYKPNAEIGMVKINSAGFRDEEFPEKKNQNEFRIVWIGDSILEGWGVRKEDRFTDILNHEEYNFEHKIKMFNLGVESYSNYQELIVLKRKVPALKPDVVILSFCWNDILKYEHFIDSTGQNYFLIQNESNVKNKPFFQPVKSFLLDHSKLIEFINLKKNKILHALFPPREVKDLTLNDFVTWYYREWQSKQFDTLKMQIDSMKYYANKMSAKLFIVSFPLSFQIHQTEETNAYGTLIENTQSDFEKYCEREQIPFYNIKSDLYDTAKKTNKNLYLDIWHFNKEGHMVAAYLIKNFIGQQLPKKL